MSAHTGPTVYLHIGTPKSGTTYLQSRFAANHRLAARQGLLWPGPSWDRHVAGVRELRRLPDGEQPAGGGPWQKLADDALGWGGDAVLISMEWLAALGPHQARMAVESLRPGRVEVICTARDLLRSFVAQGQEMAKNYRTWPWARIVEEVLADRGGPAHRAFWRQQDLAAILSRWGDLVGPDRVHLVTVPPPGAPPEVLWERFCAVLGIDGSGFTQPEQVNESLGVVSTVLMQRLNTVARSHDLPHLVYDRALRQAVAVDVLGPRRAREAPIAVSEELEEFLRERASQMLGDLQGLPLQLHGAWEDLLPRHSTHGRRPEEVSEAEILELALEALTTLAVQSSAEIDRLRRRQVTASRATRVGWRPGQVLRRAGRRRRGTLRRWRGRRSGDR
jgi:hypothetical protein